MTEAADHVDLLITKKECRYNYTYGDTFSAACAIGHVDLLITKEECRYNYTYGDTSSAACAIGQETHAFRESKGLACN